MCQRRSTAVPIPGEILKDLVERRHGDPGGQDTCAKRRQRNPSLSDRLRKQGIVYVLDPPVPRGA